jgi:hypothetical protein
VDFEPFESDIRPAELSREVEREFEELLEAYCAAVAGNSEIRAWVKAACPFEYATIERVGAVDRVFGSGAWICPDQLGERCVDALLDGGCDRWRAAQGAASVEKALFGFYERIEALQ